MKQEINNWKQELDDEAVEEYNALRRSLQRIDGFGLFFVQCSPPTGKNIITEIKKDISQKKIEVLQFSQPINSLYEEVLNLSNIKDIDILFISGLEHSLYEYEDYTFSNSDQETYLNSKERYSQSWRGVPRFLGYLNLQRDRFREDFDISFVFLLPFFGITYFIKRAPDFFDWRSGLFKFVPRKDILTTIDFDSIFQANKEHSLYELLELKALTKQQDFSDDDQAYIAYKQFLLSIKCEKYEEAITHVYRFLEIKPDYDLAWGSRGNALRDLGRLEQALAICDQALKLQPDDYYKAWGKRGNALRDLGRLEQALASYDQALKLQPDDYLALYNRGYALGNLGRLEQALASYDQALKLQPDDYLAWYNRGYALQKLGRYSEAVASYDKAIKIKPDDYLAWYNRGYALGSLGRYSEAVASYDKAIKIKPDNYNAWNNRGNALGSLGRYSEAVASFDKTLEIKPDDDFAWYNRGYALGSLGRYSEAVASYNKALEIKPELLSILLIDLIKSQWQKLIQPFKSFLNKLINH